MERVWGKNTNSTHASLRKIEKVGKKETTNGKKKNK